MIGIINLEEIVQECLSGQETRITRLFPLVCEDQSGSFFPEQYMAVIKNAHEPKINVNSVKDPFLASIDHPKPEIQDSNLANNPSILLTKLKSSDHIDIFSYLHLIDIDEQTIINLGSLDDLAKQVEDDTKKSLTQILQNKDLAYAVFNIQIDLKYNASQKTVDVKISGTTSTLLALKFGINFSHPNYQATIKNIQQQKQNTLLRGQILAHTIIFDYLIKKFLGESNQEFYFCIGDHEKLTLGRNKAKINHKHNNIFLMELKPIQDTPPNPEGYSLSELLGEGSYKRVYKGNGTNFNNTVALKTINIPLLALQPNIRRAIKAKIDCNFNGSIEDAIIKIFREEAQLMLKATQARSKNLPIIFGATYDEKTQQYIIIEELGDETLADVLKREQKLSPEKTYEYIKQIINGLKQLHSLGFVHGDLKPENILVNKDGTVRITDFGWSSQIPLLSEHYDDPRYLTNLLTSAPELFDCGHATELSDLWSVGVIAYRMMTGEWPFNHEFTGNEEKWKVLSLEEKQKHAKTIREEIEDLDRIREIRDNMQNLRRPYVKHIPIEYDQYGDPGPSEEIQTPFNFYDNLFRYTLLVHLVEHENIDLDSGRKLMTNDTLRQFGFMYLAPDMELK